MSDNAVNAVVSEATEGTGLKLDVHVRPIAPMDNLLGYASVTINGCFVVDGLKVCSGEKGLYVNMPASQDKNGNWHDVCKPIRGDFRRQLTEAVVEGYSAAIENLQATLEASRGAAEKPSLTGALKENGAKVKSQPAKAAAGKDGPAL